MYRVLMGCFRLSTIDIHQTKSMSSPLNDGLDMDLIKGGEVFVVALRLCENMKVP